MDTCANCILEKANVNEIHNFLTFEKCADHKHYFVKLDYFEPFCRPSYGKVILRAKTVSVDLYSLIPRQQCQHRLEYKPMRVKCHN